MNLEDLRAVQSRERATDGLQDLRDSFYGDVADYIESLKERREDAAAAADDPFGDPEVQELTDKIETAEQVAEAVYERRMGKLVKQASLAAAGMPDNQNGLTAEERDLYGALVERIEDNKSHVLDVISGEADPERRDLDGPGDDATNAASDTSPDSAPGGTDPASESSAAAAMGGDLDASEDARDRAGGESAADDAREDPPEPTGPPTEFDARDVTSDEPADDGDGEPVNRTTVRVTSDVGEIFGVDERPYSLEAEDIVTLPEENAAPLVEKGAAEKLD